MDGMEEKLDKSFLQVPFDHLTERIDGGKAVLLSIMSLFQDRLDIADREIEFSGRARANCLHGDEIKQCNLERALGYFKNYHLYNSKDQAVFRKSVDDEVLLPLSVLASKRSHELATQSKHIQYEDRNYSVAMDTLDKAKVTHAKLTDQITSLHAKLSKRGGIEELEDLEKKKGYFHGFFGTFDPEQEREKMKKKLEKLKLEYATSHSELMSRKNAVLESMIALDRAEENASDIYEVLERHRVEKISASLTKFCSLERKYLESRLQHLELLETGAVAKLDPEADVNSFVNANKKPLDTLRRSYAVQILQLSHLSRSRPDDCVAFLSDDDEDGVGSNDDEDDNRGDENPGGQDGHSDGAGQDGVGQGQVELKPSDAGDIHIIIETTVAAPSECSAPSEESPPPVAIKSSTPSRSHSISSSSSRHIHTEASSPEMCIQERIARRNLDAIFSVSDVAASTIAGLDRDSEHSISTHGSETSTPPVPAKKKMTKSPPAKFLKKLKSRQKQSSSYNSLQLAEDRSAAYLAVHPEEWRSLFADADGRKYFLQILDEKRSGSAMIHPRGFKALTTAMQVFLDECEFVKDRTSAMRMANMGNTFHSYSVVEPDSESNKMSHAASAGCLLAPSNVVDMPPTPPDCKSEGAEEEGAEGVNPFLRRGSDPCSPTSMARKTYLQREKVIKDHSIWRSHRFWEDALQQGVVAQLKLTEAVIWDELSTEALNESITAVQNIIFGQLGGMAFTMHEIGLPQNEVERMIADLCRVSQLPFYLRKELMRSTSNTFLNVHDEDDVHLDSTMLPPTLSAHKPVHTEVIPLALQGDAAFLSETKESQDDLWWGKTP